MKTTFLMLMLSNLVYSQDIQWEKSLGGRQAEYLFDAQPTADYGFIIAGSSLSNKSGNMSEISKGDLDYMVWKLSESGETEWQKSFGGSGSDLLKCIKGTSDGGYILAGSSNSEISGSKTSVSYGGNDFWVIKLDASGNEQWQKTFGGDGQDDLVTISVTKDGGYIMGGSSDSEKSHDSITNKNKKHDDSRGGMDYWVIKLDVKGNVEWQKTFGGDYVDLLATIKPTLDGGYIVGGYSNSNNSGDKNINNLGNGGDFWILKLDSKGDVDWQKSFGGDGDDYLYDLIQIRDGSYVAAGSSNSSRTPSGNPIVDTDFLVVNFDQYGVLKWSKSYDFGKTDILISIVEEESGNIILGGYSAAKGELDDVKNEFSNDYLVAKISNEGDLLWSKTIGSKGEDILKKIILTRDGGYVLCGTSDPEYKAVKKLRKSNLQGAGLSQNIGNQTTKNDSFDFLNSKSLVSDIKRDIAELEESINNVELMDIVTNKFGLGDINPLNSNKFKGPKKELNFSRDKSASYGNKDFWIVKLKDRTKKVKERIAIEAIPNPVLSFTNIIISYEFESGTASLYDLNGRELEVIDVFTRTIPIDMTKYPQGIYIVTIKTEKAQNSVKVIKSSN